LCTMGSATECTPKGGRNGVCEGEAKCLSVWGNLSGIGAKGRGPRKERNSCDGAAPHIDCGGGEKVKVREKKGGTVQERGSPYRSEGPGNPAAERALERKTTVGGREDRHDKGKNRGEALIQAWQQKTGPFDPGKRKKWREKANLSRNHD